MDWKSAVLDLEAVGMTLTEIASAIGLSPQALSDIKQGRSKEPRGMCAVRLYELHTDRCPSPKRAA